MILLKRGLEEYTRTDAGAVYAIADCPQHENPLHLIPHVLRQDLLDDYGVYVEGELCPMCSLNLPQEHEHSDLGILDRQYAEKTLGYLYELWKKPVHLKTFSSEDETTTLMYTASGMEVGKWPSLEPPRHSLVIVIPPRRCRLLACEIPQSIRLRRPRVRASPHSAGIPFAYKGV